MHFHFEGAYRSNRECFCGLGEKCIEIQDTFRKLKDLRGQTQVMPNPTNKKDPKTPSEMNRRKHRKRCIAHRREAKNVLDNQGTNKVWIALWHFDKRLLASLGESFSTVPNFIPLEDIKRLPGLYSDQTSDTVIYDRSDKCPAIIRNKTQEIALVPTVFDIERIQTDIELAKHDCLSELMRKQVIKERTDLHGRKLLSNARTSKRKSNPLVIPTVLQNEYFLRLTKAQQRTELDKMRNTIKEYVERREEDISVYKKIEEQYKQKLEWIESAIIENEEIMKNKDNLTLSKLKEMREEKQNVLVESLQILCEDGSGLNRLSMCSREVFERNPKLCKSLYGFSDFDFFIDFIESAFDLDFSEPETNKGQLSDVEQVLLTLLWTNTFWNREVIGFIFGIRSPRVVSKYINKWMPLLGECDDMMSSLLPFLDADAIDKLEPESYREMNLRKVGLVVDGKDFLTETVRSDHVLNCALASNKMHHSAFRILTWSLPCGAVVERTAAFFSRASEKALMNCWGAAGRLKLPVGYLILGDKGFDGTAACYENYNTTLHPAFLTNKQFNKDQINHNLTICQKRYSCKTVYSRVTETAKLSGIFKRENFHHFEALVGWGHGRANLCYGYLQKNHE